MALGGGGGSAAEQTTLPADVALAWASLERARAVLRRLERGAERQERSRVARTPRAGRLLPRWGRTPERGREDAAWRGSQPARRSPPSGCRLEGDFPERGAGGGLSSRTVGCPPPAGSSSGARRTRLPDAQQDPRPAGAAVGLSSRSSPSPEGALPASSGKGRLAAPGPAGSLRKGASPHRAAQPPAPPRPVPGEGLRAWRLAGLKEDSPEDRKLQRLKAKIREQQQRRQPRSRHVPGGGRPAPGSFGEGPQAWLHPLKRTVRTLALAAAGGTTEGPGRRGGAARMRKRKRKAPSHGAPVARRAWRERGACPCGASAWRGGQKLARKILGPWLAPPRQRGSPEEQAVAGRASAARTDPGQGCSAAPRLGAQRPGGERRSRQGRPSEAGDAGCARAVAGSGQAREVPLKVQDLGEEAGQQPRPRSRKEAAGPDPGSGAVQVSLPSGVTEVPARDPLLGDCRGRSARGGRSLSRSPQSSAPVPGGTPSGKENRPTSCGGPKGRGRHPYSPEEVREFMTKKVAERSRRVREEKQTSQQAREARKRRLQEVYRKQRAALGSKRSHAEAPRLAEGTSPLALDRQDSIQGHLSDAPSGRAFSALLRKEPKGSSSSGSSFSLQTDGRVKRSRTWGSPSSWALAGGAGSPLRLRDLATSPALPQSPLLPGRAPLGAVAPASPSGRSLPRSTEDRLRVVQGVARELSARVESAMARLRAAEGPLAWSSRGGLPGWVSAPEGESGKAPQTGALPQPSCFQSPSAGAPRGGEEAGQEEEGVAAAAQAAEGGLRSSLAALTVLHGQTTPEEKPSAVRARGPEHEQEVQESRGEAAVLGFPTGRGLAPGQPAASASRAAPLFLAGSLFAVSSADPLAALRQNSGAENSREKQSEKVDVEEAQETGLQPGTWLDFSRQQEASVRSPPSANLTHSKDESEDRSEATSRWSEASPFYGGSSTFCRCGLTMAAQCLREEELRARHQSALLRLREEALREQLRAELAWLEQRTRLQGPEGASSAEEQQDRIRTRLKQEQAEIQHLQNVCRAARQRRRLLLRQHQELLRVRQSTVWLWRETHRLAGASQRPADAGNPTGLEGATVLEKGASSATASSRGLDVTTRPGDRSGAGLMPGGGYSSLCAERGATPSPRTEVAEGAPEWESQELLGVAAGDLHARRGRAECPLPQTGSTMGTADGLVSQAEDPGWTTHSKEDHRCASSDEGPAATDVSLESWASAAPLAQLCPSSPGTESLPLDSEFHKARAVLVNISGSSSSASDWEAEASQATDVSLPEEFVLPEPLHEAGDAAGTAFPDAPAVPQITREPRGHVSCGESQGGSSVLHSLEEPPEDTAGSSGTPQSGAADDGVLKSDSAQAGGTLSSQADAHPDKHNAALPKASALLPKSAEKSGLDKMLFQGRPQSVAAVPSSVRCPENWRKQSPTLATGTAERDAGRRQGRPDLDAQPIPYAREASSNNGDATSDPARGVVLLPNDQMPPLTRPPSSQGLSSPGSRASPTERPGGGTRVSSGPDVGRESKGHAQADAQTSFAKTVESAKEPQHLPAAESPSAEVSEPGGLRSRSPNAGKVSQGKSFLSGSKDSPGCVSDELVPGVEDAVRSRVDEALPCRSPDPPSQDAAFPSEDLPAPPEDPRGTQDDSSHSTLSDFPPPPEQLLFPEAGEFESSTVESASAKSNPAPASLLENPLPEAPGPLPLVGAAGAASAQGSSAVMSCRGNAGELSSTS